MLKKIQPKDLIAAGVIVAYIILKLKGLDGTMNAALFIILGYYFARRKEGVDKGL